MEEQKVEQKAHLSFIGMGMGSIALLLALLHFWAGPFSPQPSLEQVVADKAVALKNKTIAALKGQDTEALQQGRKFDRDRVADIVSASLGGLAIILAVFGIARREPMRVAGGAAVLGGGAIAFQFLALALGAIVLAILVAAVLSQIGIS